MLSIPIVSFCSSLNRLNVSSACHKIVPINVAQNLRLYSRGNQCSTTSLIKVPLLKVRYAFTNISLPFLEVHLVEGWPQTTLLFSDTSN